MTDTLQREVIAGPFQVEIKGKRYYRVEFSDGAVANLRSVTTIGKDVKLASYLDIWEMEMVQQLGIDGFKNHMRILAERGTLVHSLIERHILGHNVIQTFDIAGEDWKKYESFLRWEDRRQPEYIWTEKILYSLQHGYAGRADCKAIVDGKRIVDWKTSAKPQDSHRCQVSAYVYAEREMGEDVEGGLVLALGAENKQGYTESELNEEDLTYYMKGFLLKNQLINWQSPIPT